MDNFPLFKQIEYLRSLIANEEENYKKAVINNADFYTLKSMRIDIKLLKEYLKVLAKEQNN